MGEMERCLVDQMNAHSKTEEEHFRKMREELSQRVVFLRNGDIIIGGNRHWIHCTKSLDNQL